MASGCIVLVGMLAFSLVSADPVSDSLHTCVNDLTKTLENIQLPSELLDYERHLRALLPTGSSLLSLGDRRQDVKMDPRAACKMVRAQIEFSIDRVPSCYSISGKDPVDSLAQFMQPRSTLERYFGLARACQKYPGGNLEEKLDKCISALESRLDRVYYSDGLKTYEKKVRQSLPEGTSLLRAPAELSRRDIPQQTPRDCTRFIIDVTGLIERTPQCTGAGENLVASVEVGSKVERYIGMVRLCGGEAFTKAPITVEDCRAKLTPLLERINFPAELARYEVELRKMLKPVERLYRAELLYKEGGAAPSPPQACRDFASQVLGLMNSINSCKTLVKLDYKRDVLSVPLGSILDQYVGVAMACDAAGQS